MKKILSLITLALFGLSMHAQVINTFPTLESFENGADDGEFFMGLGTGWQIYGYGESTTSGSPISSGVSSSHYAAAYYASTTPQAYSMETYAFQVGNYDHAKLSFYYANPDYEGDVDELHIGLRFATTDDYTTVWSTAESHDEWTYVEVSLPVNHTHVQLLFTAITRWGYGVCLDRMKVEAWNNNTTGTDYTVTNGSDVTYEVPDNSIWKYSLSEMIYPYMNMPSPGNTYDRINSISFYYMGPETGGIKGLNRHVDIYMKNVTRPDFSDGEYEPVTVDNLVYSGYLIGFAEGWITVELDRPFYYKNYSGNHMMIAIDDNTGEVDPLTYFKARSLTAASIRCLSDTNNPDPLDVSSISGMSWDGAIDFLPNLMINYDQMMPATVPYYTDFDDDEFGMWDGPWMLKNVVGEDYANWYFQGALAKSDYPGLASTSFNVNDHSSTVLAERLVRLSNAAELKIEFNVTVDGECSSSGSSVYDYVMAFLAPASENWLPSRERYASDIPYIGASDEYDLPYALHFGEGIGETKLYSKDDETVSTIISNPGPGEVYKLIFVWRNDYSQGNGTGAYIDNISITEVGDDGVAQNESLASNLSVMPNPAKDVITVTGLNDNEEVSIYNALGQVVKTARLSDGQSLSISGLSAGVYVLRGESTAHVVKFTVQ